MRWDRPEDGMAVDGRDFSTESTELDASLSEAEPSELLSDVSLPFWRNCWDRWDPSNDCVEEAAREWKLELTNCTGERLSRCDRSVVTEVERDLERDLSDGISSVCAMTGVGSWLCDVGRIDDGGKGGSTSSPILSTSLSSSEEISIAAGVSVTTGFVAEDAA